MITLVIGSVKIDNSAGINILCIDRQTEIIYASTLSFYEYHGCYPKTFIHSKMFLECAWHRVQHKLLDNIRIISYI